MYNLSIVTPEKVFYEDSVSSMILPGSEGYLGVLTNHAPLITAVIPGKVTITDQSGSEIILSVTHGFFEVSANHATLLADSVEYATEIDLERAKESLERAFQRMRDAAGEVDLPRAKKAMERAKSRIRIAEEQPE